MTTTSFPFLSAIHRSFSAFASDPLLPFLPFSGFTLIHAIRVAYLYHQVLDAQGVRVGSRPGQVSYLQAALVCASLVMSGSTMASILQAQPPSLLVDQSSGSLVSAYMFAAAAMKWLHPFISKLPTDHLKLFFALIDGFATTFGTISLGLEPVLQNPRFSVSSPSGATAPLALPTIILPLLSGSGASLLVPLLGLFKPQFTFSHPSFLSERLPVDIWGTLFITALYGTIVDGRGPIFGSLRNIFALLGLINTKNDVLKPNNPSWIPPEEAHVLCSLVLSGLYIFNELGPEFFSTSPSSPSKAISKSKKSEKSSSKSSLVSSTPQMINHTSLTKRQSTGQDE